MLSQLQLRKTLLEMHVGWDVHSRVPNCYHFGKAMRFWVRLFW